MTSEGLEIGLDGDDEDDDVGDTTLSVPVASAEVTSTAMADEMNNRVIITASSFLNITNDLPKYFVDKIHHSPSISRTPVISTGYGA